MIWRLEYCNKFGDTARLDIQKGASTPVEIIEGTGNPFSLNYKLDAPNKTGYFMSSSAEISIFETSSFNIDRLKTSNETELKVNYYVNSALKWTGFILPDFFSRQIGEPAVVEMTATDRLGALKGATLTGLTAKVSLRSLLNQSLVKTGLTLPLNATASFTHGATNILDTEILSQRLTDNKGRSISCYDIIKSILVATNATIRQVNGEWRLYNKIEHEAVASSVTFNEVERGARRTIEPVASSVGVFKEFGGGRKYPLNYDFSQGAINWTPVNGFAVSFGNREILGYTIGSPSTVNYGNPTEKQYLVNDNEKPDGINTDFNASPYLKYEIAMPSGYTDSVNISVDINAIGIRGSRLMYQLLAKKGTTVLSMGFNGDFTPFENDNDLNAMWLSFPMEAPENAYTKSKLVTGKLEDIDLSGYTLELRLYGLRLNFVNYLSIKISDNAEISKGDLYKTEQIGEFTKKHETDTVIFGDYLTKGLNGYFYEYPIDDTSNLYIGNDLTTGVWTSYNDSTQLPLLQHVTRQKSRLFSIAHDILRATIELRSFDPLAIYQSCDGEKWVIIESNYDFLRSKVDVVLEQIKYGALEKRDFIYSYFGEGEDNIKSVGGISGGTSGGGGGGGGMTSDQIAILNDVAQLAHLHENKEIIDQITQDMVDNASREIVASTDTETELTDENILSALRVLAEITKNNDNLLEDIKNKFLSKIEPDTAQKLIKFVEGIEVGEFTTGALGSGAAIKMVNGTSYAEVDHLTVRQKATFRELIIEALKHIGAQLVLSPARMKCNKVVDGGTYYKCYFDTGDGEVSNEFVADDQAKCQVFTGSGTKFYWRLVTSVGADWINLSKTDAVAGSDAPTSGDDISQLGNRTDTTRQSAIILSTVGADAPSWKQYSGINSFDLASKETTVFTRLGNRIQGKTVFTSGGTNLEDVLDGVGSDIQDTQGLANAAALKAQQAIDDAEANVGLINTEVGRLQAQLDGEVSNWFYDYTPTLSNYPASDWDTTLLKDSHIGDTFTNIETAPAENAGKSWRFVKNGSVYSWTLIADSDAVKALLKAAEAQATADGKSTTFLIQPTKYHLGDMWVLNSDITLNGTAYKQGEILTATQDSETFVQAHWLKRVRYTDDSAVDNLEIGGRNLFEWNKISYADTHWELSNEPYELKSKIALSSLSTFYVSPFMEVGEQYTISFEIKASTSGIAWENSTLYLNSANTTTHNAPTLTPDKYARVQKTFTWQDGGTGRMHIYISGLNTTTNYVLLRNIQIEKGNKATDWTPAPEDVQAEIDSAQNEAENAKIQAERAQLQADGYMRARYVRDWLKGNTDHNTNNWSEIKIINKAGVNLALGLPANNISANGTWNASFPKTNVIDGNTSTQGYIPQTTPTENYVQIDLGQVHYDIDYIQVWHAGWPTRMYYGTKTEISEDGVNWTTIFDSAVEGTYAETAEGKIHTQRYASVMNRIAETEAKTRFQTLIDGGLIYTALMKLFDTISGDETAFISGKQGAGKNLPAFGAGGSYQDALAGIAKAIIRHDGTVKFTDAEITGVINAISGTIGGLSLEGKKLFSQNHKLQIDGEEATISLLDPNTDALRTIIKPTNIATSVASYFASSSISPASIATIKANYTKTIWNLASSSITLNATGGKTFEVSIPAFSVTMGVTHPGGAGIGSVYARMAVYLTNGSSMKQPLTSLASTITSTGGIFSKTDDYPAQKVVVTNSGNYYLRVELTHSPEAVSPNGQFSSTATSFTASEVVNRSEIGSNGMVIATSDTNYSFMVGNTFEVRRGNSGLRITNSGIQKWNGTSWVAANI